MTETAWGSNVPVEEIKGGTNQSTYTSGDILYASSSNTLSKLGIGSTDDMLTLASGVPSWSALSSSSYSYVSQTTASSDATISFTSLDTSPLYILTINNLIPSSAGATLRLRTSTNNGSSYDSGASDYAYSYRYTYPSATSGSGSTGASSVQVGRAEDTTGAFFNIYLYNPSGTGYTGLNYEGSYYDNSNGYTSVYGQGIRKSAADVDAFQVYFSSGNISSGDLTLYKVIL